MGKNNHLSKSLFIVIIVLLLVIPVHTLAIDRTVGDAGSVADYKELDIVLEQSADGDTVTLLTDINSTRTRNNVTVFNTTITLNSNGFKILANNTLEFSGNGKTITFGTSPAFYYDTVAPQFANATFFDIIGTSLTLTGQPIATFSSGALTNNGVRIAGNRNTINTMFSITGTGLNQVINITGGNNTITMNGVASTSSTAATAKGISLIGDSNTLTIASANITAAGGKILLDSAAERNTISDVSYSPPTLSIFNASVSRPVQAYFFYNNTWSASQNQNARIQLSEVIPLTGAIEIRAYMSNVTGAHNTQWLFNNTVSVSSTGYSGGLIINDTRRIAFQNVTCQIPVNISFGTNNFASYQNEAYVGSVYMINFNPAHSLAALNFNHTRTTNWTSVADFTSFTPSFVIEAPTSRAILGNLTFTTAINATNTTVGDALSLFGQKFVIPATGDAITLDMSNNNAAMLNVFNKAATLTVYPTSFTPATTNLAIAVISDGGTTTTMYQNGVWLNRGDWVNGGDDVTITGTAVRLPVQHFSRYSFYEPSSGGGGGVSGSDSSSTDSGPSVKTGSSQSTETVVNVGGLSAITKADVTGVGISNVIITALPVSTLPASVSPPATEVYQYIEITPARFTEISSAELTFTVPVSWLREHGYTKFDVAMMRNTGATWSTLPTRIAGETKDTITYIFTTPGFSYFAIGYQKGAVNETITNVTAIQTVTRSPTQQTPLVSTTNVPKTTTTSIPVTTSAAGAGPLLVITGISCGLGIFLVRTGKK